MEASVLDRESKRGPAIGYIRLRLHQTQKRITYRFLGSVLRGGKVTQNTNLAKDFFLKKTLKVHFRGRTINSNASQQLDRGQLIRIQNILSFSLNYQSCIGDAPGEIKGSL